VELLTGIVMERIGSHVILMTSQGEFKKVRIAGSMPDIGEEVRIPVVHRRFFNMPRASWLAAAAAVILLVLASPLLTTINQPPEVAMAYISVDINPSVELTMSNRYNIIDAQAINADGEKILAGVDIKGSNVKNAVASIAEEAIELGFIRKNYDNEALLSVSLLPGVNIDKDVFEKTLVASANSVLQKNKIEVAFQTIHVPSVVRENAKKKGLSSGKYAVLIEAVNAGLSVTEKDMQEKSIVVAISNAGGQPEQIIGQARQEEQFDLKEQKYRAIASQTRPAGSAPGEGQTTPGVITDKPAGDTVKPNQDNKLIEPIRRDGGPEDRRSGSSVNVVGDSTKTGTDNNEPAVTPPVNTTPTPTPDDTTGSDDVNNNYMGPEEPSGQPPVNDDQMSRVKPNF